jgi:hypothetical protein
MGLIGVIGANGMVGSNIYEQFKIDHEVIKITRENIREYSNEEFDIIFCAAVDGRKYLANLDPYKDLMKILLLFEEVKNYKCRKFVLISTVDVYNNNINIGDEDSQLNIENLNYGNNRLILEKILKTIFNEKLIIVRLQGLIAKNLKKNILFDIKMGVSSINFTNDSTFQFYPLPLFRSHFLKIMSNNIVLCNLSAEPINVFEILDLTNLSFSDSITSKIQVYYKVKSKFSGLVGNNNGYWVSKDECKIFIKKYIEDLL